MNRVSKPIYSCMEIYAISLAGVLAIGVLSAAGALFEGSGIGEYIPTEDLEFHGMMLVENDGIGERQRHQKRDDILLMEKCYTLPRVVSDAVCSALLERVHPVVTDAFRGRIEDSFSYDPKWKVLVAPFSIETLANAIIREIESTADNKIRNGEVRKLQTMVDGGL